MWQEVAIYIIGILVVLYAGKKIYGAIVRPPRPGSPCSGCSGCSMKKDPADSPQCPGGPPRFVLPDTYKVEKKDTGK